MNLNEWIMKEPKLNKLNEISRGKKVYDAKKVAKELLKVNEDFRDTLIDLKKLQKAYDKLGFSIFADTIENAYELIANEPFAQETDLDTLEDYIRNEFSDDYNG